MVVGDKRTTRRKRDDGCTTRHVLGALAMALTEGVGSLFGKVSSRIFTSRTRTLEIPFLRCLKGKAC
jgi:hypothetical protein